MKNLPLSRSASNIIRGIAIFVFLISWIPFQSVQALPPETNYAGVDTGLRGDDTISGDINIGFNFTYYGNTYSLTQISTNGLVCFGNQGSSAYTESALPSTGSPNNCIYAFWDDLMSYDESQLVLYRTIGTAPNREFIVQWTNYGFYNSTLPMGTFQVILYETSNNIRMQYRQLLTDPRSYGDSAAIGLENYDGTVGLQYLFDTASLYPEQSILYTWNGSNNYNYNASAAYEGVYLYLNNPPPAIPTLISPADNSANISTSPTFTWNAASGATSYTVIVSTNANLTSPAVNATGITSTSYSASGLTSSRYYWAVKAVNAYGESWSESWTYSTLPGNSAPTDISLSNSTVPAGSSGALVGYLSTTDPDGGDTHTYSLVSGTGSTNNGSFSISGNELRTAASLTAGSYSVRIRTTDSGTGNLYYEEAYSITVQLSNQPPVISQGDSISVTMSEDSNPIAFNLTLNASDPNPGDTLTWSISSPATHGSAGASGTGTSKSISYTPTANYYGDDSFTVQVSDGNGGTDSIVVNVTITAVDDPPQLIGTNPTFTYAENNPSTVIDAGITFTDIDGPNLSGVTVSISSNYTSGQDFLDFTPSGGVTGSFNTTTGVLTLSGSATASTYQTVLRSVSYRNTSNTPNTSPRTISFVGDNTLFNVTNGHFYEFVTQSGISWSSANTGASASRLYGMTGYMATITTSQENSFISSKLAGVGWIGANDAATEGTWQWVTGPEAGTTFCTGNNPCVPVSSRYSNWNSGEPNNAGDEDYGHMIYNTAIGTRGSWNDLPNAGGSGDYAPLGYIVEYGGMAGDPVIQLTSSATINVQAVNDIPIITQGDSRDVTMDEDGSPTPFSLTLNASDLDGDTLTWSVSSPAAHGTASASGTGTSKAISYSPQANYNGLDSFTVQVSDGNGGTDSITINVTINSIDDPPNLSGSSPTIDFSENGLPSIIDPTISFTDIDGPNITGATIAITENYVSGEDYLDFTGSAGITGSFNSTTGVLTLTGSATAEDYQSVFRSVTYQNTSENPDTSTRKIVFVGNNSLFNTTNNHFYEFVSSTAITWTNAQAGAASRNLYGMQGYLATIVSADENAFITDKLVGVGWIGASDVEEEGTWKWVTGPEAGTVFCTGNDPCVPVDDRYSNWNTGEPNNGSGGIEHYGHMIYTEVGPRGSWNDMRNEGGSGPYLVAGYVVEYGGMAGDPAVSLTSDATINVQAENDAPYFSETDPVELTIDEDNNPAAFSLTLHGNDVDLDVLTWTIQSPSSHGDVSIGGTGNTRPISYEPDANYYGADSFTIRINDLAGGIADIDINLTINQVDDSPTIANYIPDQAGNENVPFNFVFAENTFHDVDDGTVLTYSATLQDGSALPAWLSFDPDTRTFSGVPDAGQVLKVRLTATDNTSLSVYDDFLILIQADGNSTPINMNPLDVVYLVSGTPFSFQLPESGFVDEEGQPWEVIASLPDYSPLPSWLVFDPEDLSFSGTPPAPGELDVLLKVFDDHGGFVSVILPIEINEGNVAPTLLNRLADQAAYDGMPFSFVFPANTFWDANGDSLAYVATLSDGSALPAWLSFNMAGREFSGTPAISDLGIYLVRVTAIDPSAASTSDLFLLGVSTANRTVLNMPISVMDPLYTDSFGSIYLPLGLVPPDSHRYLHIEENYPVPPLRSIRSLNKGREISMFGADGTQYHQFDLPLKVCIPVTQQDIRRAGGRYQVIRIGITDSATDPWVLSVPIWENGSACIETNHLSMFDLFYRASSDDEGLPDTGFAPGQVTRLDPQPVEAQYQAMSDLTLQIRSLGVNTVIVGVPQTNGSWDVTWLGNQAGWLAGSAYPTWSGNSVITGHLTDSNGKAGVFAGISNLAYGDEIRIVSGSSVFIYQVRSIQKFIDPNDVSAVLQHKDSPWISLLTCQGYDSRTGTYRYRQLVQAELVQVATQE